MKLNKINIFLVVFSLFNFFNQIYSQNDTSKQEGETYNQAAGAAVFILVAFMFLLIFVLSAPKYKYDYSAKHEGFLAKLSKIFNRAVPIEQEEDIMFDHDFNGIRELDNRIPPWFNILFYGTIVFAAVYLLDYHVWGSGNVMLDEYTQEVRIANQKRDELIRTGAFINEDNVTLLTDAAEIDKGRQIFSTNCAPCHGPDAGGTVGPNLTDEYWIHGGGIKNVFHTIKEGVPAKGMISWKTMMNPKQIQQAASYVLSLQGTKPVNGKPPEGNKWVDSSKTKNDSLKTDSTKVKDPVKVR